MTEKSTNEEAVAQETGRENGLPLDPSSLYVSGDQLSSLTRIIEATECFLLVDAKTLRIVAVSQAFLSALGTRTSSGSRCMRFCFLFSLLKTVLG
jgi:hypothetical protein